MNRTTLSAFILSVVLFAAGVVVGQSDVTNRLASVSATNRELSIRVLELQAEASTCREEKMTKRKLIRAESVYIDPMNCNSTVGYSIVNGLRGVYADVDITDCNRRVTWRQPVGED